MTDFTINVIKIIKSIPSGKVMTYGQIAEMAGSPRGARQVSRILHSMSKKYDLPWHRVIRKDGAIALLDHGGGYEQKQLLLEEGVTFNSTNHVKLEESLYKKAINFHSLELEEIINKSTKSTKSIK